MYSFCIFQLSIFSFQFFNNDRVDMWYRNVFISPAYGSGAEVSLSLRESGAHSRSERRLWTVVLIAMELSACSFGETLSISNCQ